MNEEVRNLLLICGLLAILTIGVGLIGNSLLDWNFRSSFNEITQDLPPLDTSYVSREEFNSALTEQVEFAELAVAIDEQLAERMKELESSQPPNVQTDGPCPSGAELQPINPDEFDRGDGKIYGIAAFGKTGCWYVLEGQTLFQGWREVHEIHVGYGAQELWPHRQATLRIYPEDFSPLEEAKKLAREKCANVEEDEQLQFVPIEWHFHGKWSATFSCEDARSGDWPEVPDELLQAQMDNYPLCHGRPNQDVVCGDQPISQQSQQTQGCPLEVKPLKLDQVAAYTDCKVMFEGRDTSEELVHRITFMSSEDVSTFKYHEGSFWLIPTSVSEGEIAQDFTAAKCQELPSGYQVFYTWSDGTNESTTCP